MTREMDQIEAQALALAAHERAELAERLVESLAPSGIPSGQASWLTLAKQRRDAIRSGAITGILGEEGSAMVRRLVGK